MAQRGGPGAGYGLPKARKVRRKAQPAPRSEVAAAGGVGRPKAKPVYGPPTPKPKVKRVAPAKSPVFGAVGRQGAANVQGGRQIQRARKVARRREQRAQAQVPNRSVPEVRTIPRYQPYMNVDPGHLVVARTHGVPKQHTTGVNRVLGDIGETIAKPLKPVVTDYGNAVLNLIPGTAHLAYTAVTDPKKAAKQVIQPYKDIAKDPVGSFKAHPFSTTILVAGPIQGATRGAGALARRGAFGSAAKEGASTTRAPATLEHGIAAHPRRYSPDPVIKRVQVAAERRAVKRGEDPTRITNDQLKKRVNELEGINQSIARHEGQRVSAESHKALTVTKPGRRVKRTGKAPEGATSLIAQNIVAPNPQDLTAYLQEIRAQHPHLEPAERARNEQTQALIEKNLRSGDLRGAAQAASAYRAVERPITAKLVQYKMLNPEQAAKRVELPYAVRKMGAEHGKPRVTADVPAARKLVRTAAAERSRVERARTSQAARAGRQQGRAEVLSGQADARLAQRLEQVNARLDYQKTRATVARARGDRQIAESATVAAKGLAEQARQLEGRVGRGPVRTLAGLERERGKLTEQDLQVRAVRQKAREAEKGLTETKRLAKQQRRQPKQFLTSEGDPLTTTAIREHRQAAGLDEPAYVSQASTLTRPGSFYRHFSQPVRAAAKKFTGGATLKGTVDATHEALHANVRRLQTLVNAHEGLMRWTREFGMRDEHGQVISKPSREALQKEIDRRVLDEHGKPHPGAREWTIVRAAPFGATSEHVQGFLEGTAHAAESPQPLLDAMTQALHGQGDHGPFVAVPKVVQQQQLDHVRVLGSQPAKVLNVANSLFRRNVLAFSAPWATGNVAEGAFRSVVAGVRPGDRALFKGALEQLRAESPADAQTVEGSVGHGHYGFSMDAQRRARADEFADIKYVRQVARALGTLSRTKGLEWVPKAYGAYTGWVFHHMARLEDQFRFALAGAHIRKNILEPGIDTTAEAAIRDAAKGLTETKNQAELLRFVQRAYGQYEGWSPQFRQLVQSYTPFAAWTINATRFLFHVLPKDHPVLLAMMADIEASQRDWLKSVGLEVGQQSALPGYLQGSLITPGGTAYRVGRYLPSGLLQEPSQSLAGLVLPQFHDIQMALQGLDAFGQPLKESKQAAIAKGLATIFMPAGGQLGNLSSGQGSLLQRAEHQFNPLKPTPPERLDYARTKAESDRITAAEAAMRRPGGGAYTPSGAKTPEYKRLLARGRKVEKHRSDLLVKAKLKPAPKRKVRRRANPLGSGGLGAGGLGKGGLGRGGL